MHEVTNPDLLKVKSLASARNHIDIRLDEPLARMPRRRRRPSGHGGVIGPLLSNVGSVPGARIEPSSPN